MRICVTLAVVLLLLLLPACAGQPAPGSLADIHAKAARAQNAARVQAACQQAMAKSTLCRYGYRCELRVRAPVGDGGWVRCRR